MERQVTPSVRTGATPRGYTLLGMEDMYLDFAGMRAVNHISRSALAAVHAGDRLKLVQGGEHLELTNEDGIAVARLSRAARERWGRRLASVVEVRVVALVVRYRDEVADSSYRELCQGDSWEVPLVELVTRSGNGDTAW